MGNEEAARSRAGARRRRAWIGSRGWQSPGWVVRRIMIAARMFHAMQHIPRRREIGKCRNDAPTIPRNATALTR